MTTSDILPFALAACAGVIAGYFIGFVTAGRQFIRIAKTWANEPTPRARDYDLEEAIMEHRRLVRQLERGADEGQ